MDKQESNDCDVSCEKGKHDAASISDQHARDIPPLKSQQIDKGDNVLNPIADKLEGIKREKRLSEERNDK
ncbi:hypothetical protein ACFLVR_04430 [Chloroflexota bacterium]